jgi:hypothetical protein
MAALDGEKNQPRIYLAIDSRVIAVYAMSRNSEIGSINLTTKY